MCNVFFVSLSGGKTSTGTVFITIDDVNDNTPSLPNQELIVCERDGELGSVVIAAEDKDKAPYSAPFIFQLIEPNENQWTLSKLNGKVRLDCVQRVSMVITITIPSKMTLCTVKS